ncbi:hypothetical protein CSIM01_05741 [Colletotrichum simmondsii]|uniref:Uncharacterized protein n=1 Tax=Colletotrichum simmondsii TaxID=703756 RepID=A0A135S8T1_9PEZI|nr:hypothetical protein CSIM01_05741 [Colletotrichum simmondsii]
MVFNAENRADSKVLLALNKIQVEASTEHLSEVGQGEGAGRGDYQKTETQLFSPVRPSTGPAEQASDKHQTFQNDMTTYDETETATEPTLGRPLTKLANVEIKKKSQSLFTTAPFGCDASGHTQSTTTLFRGSSVSSAILSRTMDGFLEKRHSDVDAGLAKRQPPPDGADHKHKRSL